MTHVLAFGLRDVVIDVAPLALPGVCKALGIIPGVGEECR